MPHGSITKTEVAFRALRAAIERGEYLPGEHLRVVRLVDELGMSPTPIREALRLLQSEGLVVHHVHRGMAVAKYSPDDAVEVYELRALLEPLAAARAAELATLEQVQWLRHLHTELAAAVTDADRTDAAEINAAWHRAISNASGSRYVQEFISRLWQAIPVRAVWLSGRASQSLEQHEAVTRAIEAGDTRAARAAMLEHIEIGAISTVAHLRTVGHTGPKDTR